jgi:hypothetical protein
LSRRIPAQSRLVRSVYDLRAETQDDGKNFFLLFGSDLKLVQRVSKVPSYNFKISASDAEPMVSFASGSANNLAWAASSIAQQVFVLLLELRSGIVAHPDKELADALIGKESVRELIYYGRYSVVAAKALIKRFCVSRSRCPSWKRRKDDRRRDK